MRFLECCDDRFRVTKDLVSDLPRYAILSHTWGPDTEEVTFRDMEDGTEEGKSGYKKIKFCAEQARRDGLQYFWIDTCCIDKSNSSELSEAIASMFRWYQNATRCYVYLPDISATDHDEDNQESALAWEPAFRANRWFTRGWTLQELLAPESVEFFTQDGRRLGDKRSLEKQIHEITGIPVSALRGSSLFQFDVAERFKWAETRQTTREEDWAYCLLGIFGVFIPLIYGEGKANAVRRFRKEIVDAMNRDDALGHQQVKNRTWIVPFERNPSFTSRESELKRLREALAMGYHTAKAAITGLGGVGKTQLALEYIYQTEIEYKDRSVIWIPVTNTESLEQAYLIAAKQLGISGCEDDKANVKKLVQDHLSSESAGQWLLVFDNADDLDMWIGKSTQESGRLIDYLPRSRRGSIIFTTRDKKTAVKLAGRNIIEMSEMDETGARHLLQECLVDLDLLDSQEDATALLVWLTYLPLAIVQAAAYINENGIGLRGYLSLLDEQEEDVVDLLSEDFEDEGRYRDVKNPVATTWLISFEQIRQRDRLAADYLSFLACVDAKDVPQSLLPPGQSRKKETDAIGTLLGYSFIAKRSADSALNVHRLVHLATRNWLRKEGLLHDWTYRAIARLAELMHNLARTFGEQGRWKEAEELGIQVLKARKTKFGADHPDTLSSMNNLATTFGEQGRWKEAEELGIQVLKARKTKFGADHPDTLTSIHNLATTFGEQGRWKEAEELDIQVLKALKTKLGADHPDTLSSMNNLAITFGEQGRWKEAEELNIQVLKARKTRLGADHPNTLKNMNNLAITFGQQGRWKEAEELNIQYA
ncbi:Kinesin light chain 1 [Pleurostoma richardsiae]|uniref:Kinesin light chain 1 n=1 Tax=Pleurostoma richardsiae TaxID=41990 RepID=A0AA38RBC5_9PEZI|nr:Kinesin light chain 1 [Pleurostoma richardsiae]